MSTLDVMVMALIGFTIFEVVLGAMRHYLLSHTTNRLDDFTRFGYIEGTVQWVGTDAINDSKLGPVYPVRIQLSKAETPNLVNGLRGTVTAGMSVTSDIRTGERRMIEYFIAPMLRYKQEALRER